MSAAERAALDSFHFAAARVPAYGDFLRTRGVDPCRVRTPADFSALPMIDKDNYLRAYPLEQLCVDGDISRVHSVCVSSGSTGAAIAIPISATQEQAIAAGLEQLLCARFDAGRTATLVLVTFALGTTSAGMLASQACKTIARRDAARMVVLTPGFDVDETLRMVRRFGASFEQTIVMGYPLFLDELLERGEREGLAWSALRTKVISAGEGISERWRDRVLARIGSADPGDAPSLLGTAEAGVIGRETPSTIALRRRLAGEPALARQLFGEPGPTPMIFCYDPRARYLEAVDKELVVTARSLGAPLIRYRLHDRGGLLAPASLPKPLVGEGEGGLLYLYGRSDAVQLCGANIYIDHVAAALADAALATTHTGRFKLRVCETEAGPRLRVRVELEPGQAPSEILRERYAKVMLARLLELNREYRVVHGLRGQAAAPQIELCQPGAAGMAFSASGKWGYL